jgi:hypothetical protein
VGGSGSDNCGMGGYYSAYTLTCNGSPPTNNGSCGDALPNTGYCDKTKCYECHGSVGKVFTNSTGTPKSLYDL